jgi:hypothetical protein
VLTSNLTVGALIVVRDRVLEFNSERQANARVLESWEAKGGCELCYKSAVIGIGHPVAHTLRKAEFTMVGLSFLKATFALAIAFFGLALSARAQGAQDSVGLFCESVPQIERFLAIGGKSNEAALAIVNDDSTKAIASAASAASNLLR